ncbi:MAG: hypothetical protein GQ474_00540 [Sulfurimonas sp.]|nr:hypothetical protein [Sulfurimonas sp.]
MKKIHVYNTKGQKVCSKEYRKNKNNEVPYGFKEFAEMKKDLKSICKKCAYSIGKPYFDDETLQALEIER